MASLRQIQFEITVQMPVDEYPRLHSYKRRFSRQFAPSVAPELTVEGGNS